MAYDKTMGKMIFPEKNLKGRKALHPPTPIYICTEITGPMFPAGSNGFAVGMIPTPHGSPFYAESNR